MPKFIICLLICFAASSLLAQERYHKLERLRVLAIYDSENEKMLESNKIDARTVKGWVEGYFRNDNYPSLQGRASYHSLGLEKGFKITPKKIKITLLIIGLKLAKFALKTVSAKSKI